MAFKNVAIVGAGSIGSIILNSLLQSLEFDITVISRKESSAIFPEGVNVIKSDLTPADLEQAFAGQDVVISAAGAATIHDQTKLVDAAIKAGVKRFFPSEFSSSSQNETVVKLLPIFGVKADLIKYLKAREDQISWTGICSGLLYDWGLANGFHGFDIANRTATIWDNGNNKFTVTNEKQLGEAVLAALQRPEETKNQYLYISTMETSQAETLEAFEEATATKWTVNSTTTDEQVTNGSKLLAGGDFEGAFMLVRATAFGKIGDLPENYAKDGTLANELLGLKQESVKEMVARLL